MKVEVTAEDVMNLREGLRARLSKTIPVEERLQGLTPEEVLSRYKPEERLSGIESYVERQAILKGLQRTLRIRFKLEAEALSHLVEQLQPLELAELETLSEIALTVESLAEFEAGLRDIQQRG